MIILAQIFYILAFVRCGLCITAYPRCIAKSDKRNGNITKVAIGFYGVTRSLVTTLPSIEKHVFDVLNRENISFDVFTDTLSANRINNVRSGEHGVMDKFEVSLLRPCYASMTSQDMVREQQFDLFAQARNMTKKEKKQSKDHMYDVGHDGFASVKNILCAFYSLQSLYELIMTVSASTKCNYDAIIVLRPDTTQLIDTDIGLHLRQGELMKGSRNIFIPDFQHWGGYNDRLAFGTPEVMALYMQRGDTYIHGERTTSDEGFLRSYFEHHKVTVKYSDMRCVRVRIDGKVHGTDAHREHMNLPTNYTNFDCIFEDGMRAC